MQPLKIEGPRINIGRGQFLCEENNIHVVKARTNAIIIGIILVPYLSTKRYWTS